jgi:hypothetical protein
VSDFSSMIGGNSAGHFSAMELGRRRVNLIQALVALGSVTDIEDPNGTILSCITVLRIHLDCCDRALHARDGRYNGAANN